MGEIRAASTASWRRRIGRSVVAALAATVVLAFVAVVLTSSPRSGGLTGRASSPGTDNARDARSMPSSSAVAPDATRTPIPTATPEPTPAPLPKLAVYGQPQPTGRLLMTGQRHRVLDLRNGRVSPIPGLEGWRHRLLPRSGGGYLCVCPLVQSAPGGETMTVAVRELNEDYQIGRTLFRRVYPGRHDPALRRGDQGDSVVIEATLARDGGTLFLGLALRQGTSWSRRIEVIDLRRGSVIQTIPLPPVTPRGGGSARGSTGASPDVPEPSAPGIFASAPAVRVGPDGRALVIRGSSAVRGEDRSSYWTARLVGGRVRDLAEMRRAARSLAASHCGAGDGFAATTIYYTFCYPPGDGAVLRRVSLDGSHLGDTSLSVLGRDPVGLGHVHEEATGKWFIWNPFARTIVRLDPESGEVEATATLPAKAASTTSPEGFVASLGRRIGEWLAPAATAKMYLEPSIALSPDGSRLYVLGVTSSSFEQMGGSSGVWVIDARSLRVLDHWTATADFTSLLVSEDGRWVFAAGMPEFDAEGNRNDWPASVTVYDAATGNVRLIAGDLGQEWLFFASPTQP